MIVTAISNRKNVPLPWISIPKIWKVTNSNKIAKKKCPIWYRPLALRGHVTKQWVGILLMPKIDRAHKKIYPKIERKSILGRYFMALWFFNKVVWFALAAMLEGILLPSNMAAKTTFCLYLVKRLIVTLRCAVNVTTSSFQHFPWSLSAKFVFRKR